MSIQIRKIPQLHRQIHVQKHRTMLIINSNSRTNRIQTKTQLQQLAEGKIEFQPPKKKNTKNNKNTEEIKQKSKTPSKTEQQELKIEEKQQYTLDSFQ